MSNFNRDRVPLHRPRRSSIAAGVAAALMLTGCMVGPKYRVPSTPEPPHYREELPEGWKEAQPNDAVIRGKWWEIYNDPRLNALEEQVNISNQNVLAAEAQFREAKEAVRVARAALFPNLSVAPSMTRSATGASPGVQHTYTVPLDATYQVDVWGGIRRGVASNTAVAQASAAQLENARLLYQTELATDYFQIRGLDASRELLESTVQSFEHYLQLTKDRFEGGVASMADVALAETQLETVRAQLVDLGVQRAQFEHAVSVLTGKPPSELTIPPLPAQATPPVFAVGVPSALLERRPDVAAAERQVAAANELIGVAKSAFYPSINLTAAAGSQSTAVTDLLTWPTRFWSLGAQLAQPLFNAGRLRAQVRLTQAAYDATVANYRQTVLTAFQQVEDHLAELRVLAEESATTDRAVKAGEQSLEISTTQYRGGLANYLQVITAQTSLLQNQRSAVSLLTRRQVASVALIQALGGGWDTAQLPSASEVRR